MENNNHSSRKDMIYSLDFFIIAAARAKKIIEDSGDAKFSTEKLSEILVYLAMASSFDSEKSKDFILKESAEKTVEDQLELFGKSLQTKDALFNSIDEEIKKRNS